MRDVTVEEWTTALRSGKYKQGCSYLKSIEDGEVCYCCLGVLCEIVEVPNTQHAHVFEFEFSDSVREQLLGDQILGLSEIGEFYVTKLDAVASEYYKALQNKYGYFTTLTGANDFGATFDEIATLIEHCFRCEAFVKTFEN